jgi:hypothetical protein
MATCKDQPQAFVGNITAISRFQNGRHRVARELGLDFVRKQTLAPQMVDGLVAGGLHDPGAGKLWNARFRPLVQSGREGLLCVFFRQIEIAHQPDQGGHDPAPVRAVQCFHGGCGIV